MDHSPACRRHASSLVRVAGTASLAAALAFAGGIAVAPADERPAPPLESLVSGDEFRSTQLANLRWHGDGTAFSWLEASSDGQRGIRQREVRTGDVSWVVEPGTVRVDGETVAVSAFEWSPDERWLLLRGPQTRTWRNLWEGAYYLHDTRTGETTVLADGDATIRNVQFSPDSSRIGYVRDKNIHVRPLDSDEVRAITDDGEVDRILNGVMDYVTAQALINPVGWYWSPDSQRIVFWRSDIEHMPVFHMVDELHGYNIVHELKYPIVEEKNAIIQIGVHALEDGATTWMDIGDDDTVMIPRVYWTRDSERVAIQRMNRAQNTLDVLIADAATGESTRILRDTDEAWVDIHDDQVMLTGSDRFTWTSERSGYRHAYVYDYAGNEVRRLTSGDWEITSVVDVDEDGGWLYFYGKKDSHLDQHVYRVALDGGDVERVSPESGWYQWTMAPDGKRVVEVWSDVRTPPQTRLRHIESGETTTLLDGRLPGLERYRVAHPEFRQIRTSDGVELNVSIKKPTDFDPDKQYPVLLFGFGNAGTQRVMNRWAEERELWHRYLAERGFVVFRLDNRTAAGRGKAARNLTYGHYAKWSIHDMLEGARWLKTQDWVDRDRLAFWGWSGGGYLAAALMVKGEGTFAVGMSVAPVINLENYQSIGVERWMGTPTDNPEGYYQVNLENFADQLEGDLFMIHGTGDENVKYSFTLQFVQSLIEAGKTVDMMIYPNEHHDLAGVRPHLYKTMSRYLERRLLEGL